MAGEVGSGQVAIVPTFKGFRRTVTREVDTATSEGGRRLTTGLTQAGGTSGRGFRQAFSTETRNVGTATLRKLTTDVAAASRALSAVRLREQDAIGKVRVAEAALSEARRRVPRDSAAVIRAEERLAAAHRQVTHAQGVTRASSQILIDAKGRLAVASTGAGTASARSAGVIRRAFSGLPAVIGTVGVGMRTAFGAAMSAIVATAGAAASAVRGSLVAAGAAVVGVLGGALVGGFSRLTAIDTARAKLRGLGNDAATVDTILANALASVQGTAYGLDDAATVAAGAVAAGIRPGQELEKYLRLAGDAAAIAGVPLSEMGQILNRVTTAQTVYAEDLNQLADRGLPIYKWLADAAGVSVVELKKMASEGKIDSELYRRAIEENIGGAALALGDTVAGAWSNMIASTRRFGARVLTPIFPLFRSLFDTITLGFDAASAVVGPFADRFGGALTGVVEPALARVREILAGLKDGTLTLDLAQLFPGFALFQAILEPLIPVVRDQLMPALQTLGYVIGFALRDALVVISPYLPMIVAGFSDLLMALVPLIPQLVPLIPTLLELVPPLILLAQTLLPPLVDQLSILLPMAVGATIGALTLLQPVFQFLADWVSGASNVVKLFDAYMNGQFTLQGFADKIMGIQGPIGSIAIWLFDATTAVTHFTQDSIRNLALFAAGVATQIQAAMAWFEGIPGRLADLLAGANEWLRAPGRAIVQGLVDGILSMTGVVGDAVSSVLDFAAGFFPNSPAKRGPFAGPGWRRLGKAGPAIMQQAFGSGYDVSVLTGRMEQVSTVVAATRRPTPTVDGDDWEGTGAPFINRGVIQVTDERKLVAEVQRAKRRAGRRARTKRVGV